MSYTVFAGCSYTKGVGLSNLDNDENLWANILHRSNKKLASTKILNVGLPGASNSKIFKNAIDAILTVDCKYLFVSWTELQRINVNPGIETYPTSLLFSKNGMIRDVNLNNGLSYSESYITNIKNRFLDLCCPHYDIIELAHYTKILEHLCNKLGIAVFFINALVTDWDENYFVHVVSADRTPGLTTPYTQKLLNASTRDDEEYFQLYDKMHSEYADVGNCNWLNLYKSYREYFRIDKGTDGLHPGVKSNQQFAEFLINSELKTKL